MMNRVLSALIISAALPLSAMAQTAAPSTGDGAMKTNQNNAQGGMNDARPMGQSTGARSMTGNPFVTVPESGAWRVSDLQGKAVYGSEGESIGEINDVLVSQNGSVNAVVIGVGGFLGIGEKDVAVNMSALQLGPGDSQAEANAAARQSGVSNETTASTNGASTTATPPAAGNTTATTTNTMSPAGTAAPNATGTRDQMANNTNGVQIGEDGLPDRIILNVSREQLQDAPAFEGVRNQQQQQ
ncbi:PRC-barrel domain-containing protein [Neorhizobium petrolearium]|uniref:PRC-barrel domain-containing protein n=1 Tax=Neorhizobium petrolearium TaxID=515361 RepID=UPI003F18DD63